MSHPVMYHHQVNIAAYIRKAIKAGVAMKVILDKIQDMDGAPRNMQTLYKVYRSDIADARSQLGVDIGEKIMEKALVDGDMKALELVARSKLGWSPTQTIVEADPEDENENTSAIDDLIALLNIKKDQDGEQG